MKQLATYLAALALLLLVSAAARAQPLTRYTLAASTGTYTALTTSALTLSTGGNDEGTYDNLPLGFTFRFQGTNYTTVMASTNGGLSFSASGPGASFNNNLANASGSSLPLLAPLWDDLAGAVVRISTTGTAPHRVFTAEWRGARWNFDATGDVVSFQVKLYEGASRIQYVYTPGAAAMGLSTNGASVGMVGTSGEFISVSDLTTSATLSSTTATNSIRTKPAAGLTFTFDLGYDFAARAGTYAALPTPTAAPANAPVTERTVSNGSTDDGYYNNIPLGFSFVFQGTAYSQVGADTNGWLSFVPAYTDAIGADYANDLTTGGAALRPLLAPLWDDLTLSGGTLRTQTTGIAPNRIFTVEWANVSWDYSFVTNTISFQVKLFETSNRIWYVYQQGPAAVNNTSDGASIGLSGADGYFLSLNNTSAAPIASRTAETNSLNTRPATGQVYAFAPAGTPDGPLPVQLVAFTARRTAPTTVALAWMTASELHNAGFWVEKSPDGAAWQPLTFVPGAGSSASARSYAARDASPAPAYYRLRQLDTDGTASLSAVCVVPGSEGPAAFAAYPNPAHGPVQLAGAATAVLVYNAQGQLVRTLPAPATTLDPAGLPAGLYLLQAGFQHTRLVLE